MLQVILGSNERCIWVPVANMDTDLPWLLEFAGIERPSKDTTRIGRIQREARTPHIHFCGWVSGQIIAEEARRLLVDAIRGADDYIFLR